MALLLAGFALIVLIDFIPLVRHRLKRSMVVFLSLFVLTLTIAILQVSGVEIPSMMSVLSGFVRMLGLGY
jgi:hypothetical protein